MIDLYTVTDVPSYGLSRALAGDAAVRAVRHEKLVFANGNALVRVSPNSAERQAIVVVAFAMTQAGDVLIELGLLVDALRREYDGPIQCALPYLPYSRSNRLDELHTSFGARVYIDLLDALRVDRYLVFDLHAPELLGFFRTPVRQLSALPLVSAAIARRRARIDYVVAPDCGRYDACRRLARSWGAAADFFTKWRSDHSGRSSLIEQRRPHLEGHTLLLFDDEITSGDTLVHAAAAASAAGAAEIHVAVVYSFADLAVLRRLDEIPQVRSFTTTNLGVPVPADEQAQLRFDYEVVDCSGLLTANERPR